jgi:hypothetical protein
MSNVFMRLVTRCAYAAFSILLGGLLISTVCGTYATTPAYATLAINHVTATSTAAVSGHMLTTLPHAIQLWTSITLAWGIFVCSFYCHMHHTKWNRQSDTRITASLWAYNIAVTLFLLFGHLLAPGVGEPFFIFVLFYNTFLGIASANIVHWWIYHMDDSDEASIQRDPTLKTTVLTLNESPTQKLRTLQLNESPTQKLRRFQTID